MTLTKTVAAPYNCITAMRKQLTNKKKRQIVSLEF